MKLKFQKSRIEIFFCLFLLCSSFSLLAQTTIKGKVLSSADNMPLPGASVVEKGTTNGTQSDFDGAFILEVSNESSIIVVSYVGFKSKEVAYSSGEITVMLEDDTALEEVVVVGYGTQKKSDIVNAVATTDLSKATLSPTSDVNEMLRGRIAGLQVNVGGGTLRPGGTSDIIFRGQGSIEGNVSAIYVVDGIVREGGIEDIDADDIKSVEFLKDASAQAIYGSRGANGVVLITTKRGTAGKVSVSYHGFLTTKTIERNFDVYNGQEFAQLRREAWRSTRADDSYADDVVDNVFTDVELENLSNNRFVNWEDELMRNGFVNSQAISISGGTEMTKVFGSINYFQEDGLIPSSSYTRKTLRLNVDQKISDKFSVNFDLNLLNDDTDRSANVNVITTSPLGSAYNDDGSITRYPSGEEGSSVNPLWNLREQNHEEKGNDYVINVTPIWQITKDLQYQLKTNLTRRTSERGQYQSSLSSAGDAVRGIARIDNKLWESYLVENILTYDKAINNDHKLNLTLVQSAQENAFSRTFTEGQGFPNEDLGYNGISSAIGNVTVERDGDKFRYLGYLARARYTLMNKYTFEGIIRADGASLNGEGNKWSYNPAGSFAWKIHNESFLEEVSQIQELKFRASYGSLVNDLGRAYTSLFTADFQPYIFDEETGSGFSPSTILPNPDLKFERITTLNLGLDFSIFKNTLVGSVNWYDARTTDLLLKRGVPPVTGYTSTFFNAGEMQNTGIELGLTANIFNTEDFSWSVSTNWSNNKNKLLELYNDGNGDAITEDNSFNYYVGQPVGVIYQYAFDGIWQEGEDFENAPQANPESANPQTNLRPGDIKVKDINGVDEEGNIIAGPDGKITQEDRVFIDPNPDWFGSLSTTIAYKNFDLFLDFYAVEGATKVNPFLNEYNNGGTLRGDINGVKVDYYTPENPSTSFPRPNKDSADQYLNALAVKDASYLRLRTISLGYTLSEKFTSKINFDQVRLYVTATNVFTKTDYLGYSPEVNIRSTYSSADTGYPDAKSFTFGVRVKF
ncbi:SusC/RagA family TonB-linked outer membrane protein [Winogradskyella thalassocola]|uniref:TonB-linked outer membrane protein, SusC/RagA family n=1 Tax=Winogradskyella thalassocola TaxID=262004 RepID=A0A1G8F2T1_9FLAO|nr:TonB-dependent receptor [Winogradskyella thalassocola]SDH76397.1 TonB-linked outer membrane protein, SusC/RagA family [Winogradskyella thalassocola]